MNDTILNPKILYRIFGKQEPSDLSVIENTRWKDRFLLLTTTDYESKYLTKLEKMGFEVVPPKFTTKEAGENSAAILNSGLEALRDRGEKYAILLASGYQASMQFVDPLFNKAYKAIADLDVYFALTKDVHEVSNQLDQDDTFDYYRERRHFFPSESMAMIKIESVFPLDEELTQKGKMGISSEGIPLGGIELGLSLMKGFSQNKKPLGMMGITTGIERYAGFIPFEWTTSGAGIDSPHSVEVTSMREKLARREQTIDAAMKELNMSKLDYNLMFEHTYLTDEWDFSKWDL